jgi:hypothetical protein
MTASGVVAAAAIRRHPAAQNASLRFPPRFDGIGGAKVARINGLGGSMPRRHPIAGGSCSHRWWSAFQRHF